MQEAKDRREYREHLREALANDFQRQALDNFAVAYPQGRENAFHGMDSKSLIDEVARIKDYGIAHLEELLEEFTQNAEAAGVHVHLARTAFEANELIARIARENNCRKIVKSKSMTAEETLLNHHLEKYGLEVTETDLGEWIIQLRHEGPSHMVMPAIHLSRNQVADLFAKVTNKPQDADIEKLVKVARRELRQKYVEADMGISGANFAIAESGTIGIITNEGNARLVTTLPRVHVALIGLEKLTATLNDALKILRVLPRNATGQIITSYVTWITGANECQSAPDQKKIIHIIFLDNGRRTLAKDPSFHEVLRCVRCGACANVCPIYRMVGGHEYGHIYIGAIGLILTYFFHGKDKARNLLQNCLNCQCCKDICAAGIDLPRIIKEVYAEIQDEEGHAALDTTVAKVLKNRKLFHSMLRAAKFAQKPMANERGYIRHLPHFLSKDHGFRALPALANKAFRDQWDDIKDKLHVDNPRFRVALFSGCVQDFVYPEQIIAGINAVKGRSVALDYPMDQLCCGLPVQMMGEFASAREVARQNVNALDPAKFDYILTMCASCASHLKHTYPRLIGRGPGAVKVQQFSDRVIDFSSFMENVLNVAAEKYAGNEEKVTYHVPCHLARGMNVKDEPHKLIQKAGYEFIPLNEERVCCGFGGSYSMKFPEVSREILKKKLQNIANTGASILATDCPGCIMQMRGGLEKLGSKIKVKHTAELIAESRK
ncbi:MAG: L-lactate dehydrogenase (quinone) large subunit LdhH [Desulfoferrobacter sp.]